MGRSRVAYLLALIPLSVGLALGAQSCHSLYVEVRDMDRFDVPGEHDVVLPAGEHVVYAESSSAASFRCAVVAPDGTPIPLSSPSSKTTYSMFGHSGESVFELDIPEAGTYHFQCEGDPTVLAVGRGMGWRIFFIVLTAIGTVIATALVLALVGLRRKPAPLRAPHDLPTTMP